MRLEKILPALRRGRRARRSSWSDGTYLVQRSKDGSFRLIEGKDERGFAWFASEIVATDWELVDGD